MYGFILLKFNEMVVEALLKKKTKAWPKEEIGGFKSEIMLDSINRQIQETCNWLPASIRETARKILSIDKNFTSRAYQIYERMKENERRKENSSEIPAFFPFFCALKWYEKFADGFYYTHKYSKNGSIKTERVHGEFNRYMAVVDFTKDSNSNRFYLIDVWVRPVWCPNVVCACSCVSGQWYDHKTGVVWKDTVAVAQNPKARRIQAQPWENSNTNNSYLSSPWFLYTPGNILTGWSTGRHLEVRWLEPWINDNAYIRSIYVHGWSISEGCLVVPTASRKTVLWKLQNWGMIFSYFADNDYLVNSSILNG